MYRFIKGHGLGNDFLVLEGEGLSSELPADRVRAICHRSLGLGADGILIQETSDSGLPYMRIYNADGSQPEMCGNGLRVFALYLVQYCGFAAGGFQIHTPAGVRGVQVWSSPESSSGDIRVDMGRATGIQDNLSVGYELDGESCSITGSVVSMGNPHFVVTDRRFSATEDHAVSVGPKLEVNGAFPEGTNVEFIEVTGPNALRVYVWERGCGLTQACGTGACAAAVVAAREGLVEYDKDLTLTLPGGDLVIRVESDGGRVWMTGPAVLVAEGELRV